MSNKKRVGVVLAGCGVYDGSEIHEAVLTLLALDRAGALAVCLAPDIDQLDTINHVTGKPMAGRRNVLVEAGRIARGAVTDIAKVSATELDALVFPGGMGAAKNLSNFAEAKEGCEVQVDVAALATAMHRARKPIGAICIAPVLLAKLFGGEHARLTIGDDGETARAIEAMGARHEKRTVHDVVTDRDLRLVTTPAYMLAQSIGEAAAGIDKLVSEVLAMA